MTDTLLQVMELGGKGYSCAQIVLFSGLRYLGRENPDLIRAAAGLAQGGGSSGELCGALAGGFCFLGLHLGKGQDGEQALPQEALAYAELLEWFRERHAVENKITCDAILGLDKDENQACAAEGRAMQPSACGSIVAEVIDKCLQILLAHNIDPSVGRELPSCL